MAKLTREQLRDLRGQKKEDLRCAKDGQNAWIAVGMGTCGIAAGARETYGAILDEQKKSGVSAMVVTQTGCMGLCYSEPTVEVRVPGMPGVVYGKVDAALARRIVTTHVVGKKLVDGCIYDKPAADIVNS